MAYRGSQIALRAATIREAIRLWPLLSMEQSASTYPRWLDAMLALVERDRATSQAATVAYLQGLWAESRRVTSLEVAQPAMEAAQVETSLRVTSLVAYRQGLGAGMTREQARANALVRMSGSAARLVLDSGRQSAVDTAGRYGARWSRIASPKACRFCHDLASRGSVYRGEDTAAFNAHDHCACTAAVLFSTAA